MRMDRRQQTTAADLIARLDAKALAEALFRYGGERKARRIAKRICDVRAQEPIDPTAKLNRVVVSAIRPRGSTRAHGARTSRKEYWAPLCAHSATRSAASRRRSSSRFSTAGLVVRPGASPVPAPAALPADSLKNHHGGGKIKKML